MARRRKFVPLRARRFAPRFYWAFRQVIDWQCSCFPRIAVRLHRVARGSPRHARNDSANRQRRPLRSARASVRRLCAAAGGARGLGGLRRLLEPDPVAASTLLQRLRRSPSVVALGRSSPPVRRVPGPPPAHRGRRGRSATTTDRSARSCMRSSTTAGDRSPALSPRCLRRHGHAILSGADLVVPVPLHWLRHWRRGFNQAYELALGLGLPVGTVSAAHAADAAPRPACRRAPEPPTSATPSSSARATASTISASSWWTTSVPTGATMEACARVLREGGAREVRTLTAARVATGPPHAHPH